MSIAGFCGEIFSQVCEQYQDMQFRRTYDDVLIAIKRVKNNHYEGVPSKQLFLTHMDDHGLAYLEVAFCDLTYVRMASRPHDGSVSKRVKVFYSDPKFFENLFSTIDEFEKW